MKLTKFIIASILILSLLGISKSRAEVINRHGDMPTQLDTSRLKAPKYLSPCDDLRLMSWIHPFAKNVVANAEEHIRLTRVKKPIERALSARTALDEYLKEKESDEQVVILRFTVILHRNLDLDNFYYYIFFVNKDIFEWEVPLEDEDE